MEISHGVNVDLADVLMGELGGLEVDDDEAFQDVVIEDEIEVEVTGLGADSHLAGDEGEAMAHFQEETLELGDDGGLDLGLGGDWIFRQTEEFKDVGILDEVADGGAGRGWLRSAFGCLGGKQALVTAGFDLALTPSRIENLFSFVTTLYPAFVPHLERATARAWTGLRPMSSDGVGIMGATPVPGVFLNTGHGPLGWTMAAGAGRLVADQIMGVPTALPLAPYAHARF